MQRKLQLVWNVGQSTKEKIWKAGETFGQNSSFLTLGSNSTEVFLPLSVAKQVMEELCKSLETHNNEMKCLNSDRFWGNKKYKTLLANLLEHLLYSSELVLKSLFP